MVHAVLAIILTAYKVGVPSLAQLGKIAFVAASLFFIMAIFLKKNKNQELPQVS
jgi:hypothetical protein